MTDIARLAIEVDPKQLQAAVQQLQKLSVESAKAEVAAKKLEKAETSAALSMATANRQAATQAAQAATANNTLSASQKQAAAETRRQADAAYQAARGADLQAAASLRAAQAAMQQSQAAQKIIMSNKDAAQSYEDLLQQQDRTTRNMGRLAGQQQANMANIAAQFQDIGVTAAMGMNPMMIGLQQGAQLTGVWGSVTGTTAQKLATFGAAIRSVLSPMSLLIMAITAGIAYLIQWAMEAGNAGSETSKLVKDYESLQIATSGLSEVQNILAGVFDLTTGKMNVQAGAAINLANAQLRLLEVTSRQKAMEAKQTAYGLGTKGFIQNGKLPYEANIISNIVSGVMNASTADIDKAVSLAQERIQMQLGAGQISEKKAIETEVALVNYAQNLGASAYAKSALEDIATGKLGKEFMKPDKTRTPREKKPEKTEAQKFADMMKEAKMSVVQLKQEYELLNLVGEARYENAAAYDLENKAAQQGIDLKKEGRQAIIDSTAAEIAAQQIKNDTLKYYLEEERALKNSNDALKIERDTLNMTASEAAIYAYRKNLINAANAAGIPIDKQKIDLMVQEKTAQIQLREELDKYKRSTDAAKGATRDFLGSMKDGLLRGQSLWETWSNSVLRLIDRVIDKLLDDLVNSIFKANQATGGGGIFSFIGRLFGAASGAGGAVAQTSAAASSAYAGMKAAKGGVFTNSVVHKPTHFFAKGGTPGVMGEAGPEAIMPLQRGPDGSLGVQMYGAGTNAEPTVVQVIPSEYFDVVVDQRAAKVAAPMVVQGAMVANKVSENTSARQARRRLR